MLSDVYAGRNMAGVQRGAIKKLLVLEDLPKPANYHGGGSQPIGHGVTSTLKRILGTVPVEADGSACFEVPALRSLYFALLDEQDRSVKQMRSFVTVQPGETVGCVGCHDTRRQTPAAGRTVPLAMRQPPSRIEPIAGVPEIIDFPRDIQPILDRHCVRCHNPGGATAAWRSPATAGRSIRSATTSCCCTGKSRTPAARPDGTGRQPGNDPPYTTYSSASPLMKKIDGSHYDVRLDRTKRRPCGSGSTRPPSTPAPTPLWHGADRRLLERERADPRDGRRLALDAAGRGGDRAPLRRVSRRQLPRFVTDRRRWTPRGHAVVAAAAEPVLAAPGVQPDPAGEIAGAAGPVGPHGGRLRRGRPPLRRSSSPRTTPAAAPIVHPVVFADTEDPDYQKILTTSRPPSRLDEIKRFDMPGFRPSEHYVREMKRFGVLPEAFDPADEPITSMPRTPPTGNPFGIIRRENRSKPSRGQEVRGCPGNNPPAIRPGDETTGEAIAMYHGRELGNMVAVSRDPLLLNWEKIGGDTVLPLRKDGKVFHFLSAEPLPYRIYDPCIWKKDGWYYSLSGSVDYTGPGRKPPPSLSPPTSLSDCAFFVDRSVVEVFVNGRQCLAVRVHPGRPDSMGVSLRAQGQDAELKSLDAWRMEKHLRLDVIDVAAERTPPGARRDRPADERRGTAGLFHSWCSAGTMSVYDGAWQTPLCTGGVSTPFQT